MRGEEDIKKTQAAIDFFESAVKRDGDFALAYAGLADAYLWMYNSKKEQLWAQKALAAARQAQQLNDGLTSYPRQRVCQRSMDLAIGYGFGSSGN